jgi:hypothetical protein
MSLALLVQVGGIQRAPGRARSSRTLVFRFGLTCPINPEFSRMSGGARAPGSYRTSPERTDQRAWASSVALPRGGPTSPSGVYCPSRNPIKARTVVGHRKPPMTWAEPPPERRQLDWDLSRHQAPIVPAGTEISLQLDPWYLSSLQPPRNRRNGPGDVCNGRQRAWP